LLAGRTSLPKKGKLSNLDCIDRRIIEVLNQDARQSSASIARQVGIPERTVHNRIKRLVEANIMKTVAVVNPRAFGYQMAVDIFCELDVGFYPQAMEELLKMPEISYIAISTGDQDVSLQAIFRNSDEMQDFITHKLHQVPGMRRTRTVLIPRILKDTYEWLPPNLCAEPDNSPQHPEGEPDSQED
jgi:Lrp/AsnC family transcriptional regulator for asnA, asnC and gidA